MDLIPTQYKLDKEWIDIVCDFGKRNELGITDEKLENEFIKVFTEYFRLNEKYPSKIVFNKCSKYQYISYYSRFQLSWSHICNMYGYRSRNNNKTELKVLRLISKILNTTFMPQARWCWLKNSRGYKLCCDAIYKEYNLVVEFDGVQHREQVRFFGGEATLRTLKQNDQIKNELILKHGYKLLRISSDEGWHDVTYLRERLIDAGISIINN